MVKNRDKVGGGVMVQLLQGLSIVKELPTEIAEAVGAVIEQNGCRINLFTVYNPPQFNKKQFIDLLDNILSENCSSNTPTILTGDFNIDLLKTEKNVQEYMNVISSNGYEIEKKVHLLAFREIVPVA